MVWHTGLSGAPPDSVRCTRVNQLELATFGFLEKPLCYNSLDYPVWHWTVRCAKRSNDCQRNGRVQRSADTATVRGQFTQRQQAPEGTPDCLVRPSTDSLPNNHFGGWGYKYPSTTTLQVIQVFQTSHSIKELVQSIQDTNPIESKPLKVPFPLQANSD
jgi:hypothetical protein